MTSRTAPSPFFSVRLNLPRFKQTSSNVCNLNFQVHAKENTVRLNWDKKYCVGVAKYVWMKDTFILS